ncbi:MAG: hypothetical protein G01um101413_447 [Parcubacteria group bacterium Gr01-1014_13]|nr:MAG: hypothetical protein G01um101413_447 [Parcubacteria group bacterium Gr01-1014_13]
MFTLNLDLDKVREFYEPHPGHNENEKMNFTFPAEVKQVADELAGCKMSVRQAVLAFEAAIIKGKVRGRISFDKDEGEKYITLEVFCAGRFDVSHKFKVIKWR